MQEIWRYPPDAAVAAASTVGFALDGADGFVGTVAVARDEPSGAYLIALGGPWNGGRSLMIPAAMIKRVEREARMVHLACSRQQLRDAPRYESDRYQDAAFRRELTDYYVSLAASSRHGGRAATARSGAPRTRPAAFGGQLTG